MQNDLNIIDTRYWNFNPITGRPIIRPFPLFDLPQDCFILVFEHYLGFHSAYPSPNNTYERVPTTYAQHLNYLSRITNALPGVGRAGLSTPAAFLPACVVWEMPCLAAPPRSPRMTRSRWAWFMYRPVPWGQLPLAETRQRFTYSPVFGMGS